jgi:hypothetical protein
VFPLPSDGLILSLLSALFKEWNNTFFLQDREDLHNNSYITTTAKKS